MRDLGEGYEHLLRLAVRVRDLFDAPNARAGFDAFYGDEGTCNPSNFWFVPVMGEKGMIPSREVHVRFSGAVNEFVIPVACDRGGLVGLRSAKFEAITADRPELRDTVRALADLLQPGKEYSFHFLVDRLPDVPPGTVISNSHCTRRRWSAAPDRPRRIARNGWRHCGLSFAA